jgi:ribokinase
MRPPGTPQKELPSPLARGFMAANSRQAILLMKPPRIVIVGSSNTDMIIKLNRIPRPGETVLGGEFVTAAGGKGANQAVAAARAGGSVTFIASVGRDALGDAAIAGFQRDGIGVNFVRRDKSTPSGVALIFVAKDGENSIAVAGGANAWLRPAHIRKAGGAFAGADVVVAQLETPLDTVLETARQAARAGARFLLNPAPAQPLPGELLSLTSILTPNETEAELLTGVKVTGEETAARAADRLLAKGVGAVIITLGARGAFLAAKDLGQLVRGRRVKAVDCTAAGDVFNGALAVALGEGGKLPEAARFANAAAAISVTRFGAQPSAPRRKEIERLLAGDKV